MAVPIVVLAGGLATRLRPITSTIPKALVPVAGEPFVAHQLRVFARQGLTDVILSLGYLGEQVEAFVGNGEAFGVRVRYCYDGPVPLGTGGAVKKASALAGEVFYVTYGDSFLDTDYAAPLKHFKQSGAAALMTVLHNEGKWEVSNVLFTEGRVKAYRKVDLLPEMKHTDYGLLLFRRESLADVPDAVSTDLSSLLTRLAEKGQLAGFEVHERFYEIGSPIGLAETEKYITGKK